MFHKGERSLRSNKLGCLGTLTKMTTLMSAKAEASLRGKYRLNKNSIKLLDDGIGSEKLLAKCIYVMAPLSAYVDSF